MRYQKLSWLSCLTLLSIVATSTSVSAQTNQSDTTGAATFNSPIVSINGQNGNGGVAPSIERGSLTGSGSGSGNSNPVSLNDAAAFLDQGLNTSLDNLAAIQQGGGPVTAAAPNSSGPRRIARRSSNHACGCANPASTASTDGPRRIVRKAQGVGKSCCANPTLEAGKDNDRVAQARKMVEQQLDVSKKFIEQVNQIEPDNNIW